MPAKHQGDLTRAYINIDADDKATLERAYGRGWSAECRDIIHTHCAFLRQKQNIKKLTIGALADD